MDLINTSRLHETNKQFKNKNEATKLHWRTFFNNFGPFTSIIFSMLMYLIFSKNDFNGTPFLRFVGVLFPSLYSSMEYFLLLFDSWRSDHRVLLSLHGVLYLLLNTILFMFSFVTIISTIAFTASKWNDNDDPATFTMAIPSFFVSFAYLLSISCDFSAKSVLSIGMSTNVPIDLLILLIPIIGTILLIEKSRYHFYFFIVPAILIPVRSLKERYFVSGKSSLSVAPWRTMVFVFMLILGVFVYAFLAYGSVEILYQYLCSFNKPPSQLGNE
ncbi:hypothetical protein [Encephalitozoon cuniculi GB-M1]|uniref:UPF0328 protein ECU09_0020 n=1 Tax=Encephalitozoon cuniculi (strain GB-M1) TaxID=284813 RepID=Y902_ENCCU|nr:uncharacterized protein ECU09_0020 [Encephalitozoon cuniculi GB-M1]Q8STY8.1 RecName: Full=UPF0328 protein ECU09_0020 [Encephalitozoon cuniculi GB-M1]CAD26973.1 hypothetical protein [Encephalitozoon cuniculi GB-M1]